MKKEKTTKSNELSWKVDPKSVFDTGIFFAARQALRRHASGGNTLMIATVLALIVANIPCINNHYFEFWEQEVRLQIGSFNIFSHAGEPMTLLAFINDALMAIFFSLSASKSSVVCSWASSRRFATHCCRLSPR